MSGSAAFTSNWKDASALDQSIYQIASFLFPEWKAFARLRSSEISRLSLTLWRDGHQNHLIYLTSEEMRAEHLAGFLECLEQVADSGMFASDPKLAALAAALFAPKFEKNLLSKFRF